MLTRQSALRVAAASVSAVFISVGAVAPVYAAGKGGNGKAHASQAHASAHQSQGRSSDHAQAEAAHAKSKSKSDSESKSKSDSESEAQGTSQAKAGSKKESGEQESEQSRTTSRSHRSGSTTTSTTSSDEQPSKAAGSQGKGHTPVTVCHLLGNGGYHLLTFDQHALKAHLAHGDIYPDSTGACPTPPSSSTAATTKSHGHTPVTVCHLLGNGGYHLLTFDQHALKAHLAHGDVYPTNGTCPAPESTVSGTSALNLKTTKTTTTTTSSNTETSEAASSVAGELTTVPTRVLGVQSARAPRVLGVEAFRAGTANTSTGAPAQLAPAAGLLPNTGAARIGLPLVAGIGLLAAGAGLLLRRRGAARG